MAAETTAERGGSDRGYESPDPDPDPGRPAPAAFGADVGSGRLKLNVEEKGRKEWELDEEVAVEGTRKDWPGSRKE